MSAIKPEPFLYHAEVCSVYDGDTCRLDIDLGLGVWVHNESVRLFGINAPEVRGAEKVAGKVSRDKLRQWVLNQSVIIKTVSTRKGKSKKGKYGRYLAIIWAQNDSDEWYNVNERLVSEGLAVFKDY
ncbi:MAG: thermonuclease family protein [Mariprofundus sp.]|nr:thermonuclease family protein [Mariprofundus sp.]